MRINTHPAIKATAAIVLGAAILSATPTQSSAQTTTPVKFVLDWAFEGPQATWSQSIESGCYAKSGIDLKTDRGFGSGDSISKVASGAYDVGIADFSSVVAYNAAHPDNKLEVVFIVSDRSPTSVTVLKTSGITKPKDLEGKRIADSEGEASRVLFPAFAKKNGIDLTKITWVTVAPNLRQTSLVQGQADAAAGHMFTVQTGLEALKVTPDKYFTMAFGDYGVEVPGSSIITKKAWAEAHPDALKAFIACSAAGVKSSYADAAAAVATLKKYNSLSDPKSDMEGMNFANNFAVGTAYVKKNGLSQVNTGRLNTALSQISEALNIPKPAVSDIWNGAYLPAKSTLMLASK